MSSPSSGRRSSMTLQSTKRRSTGAARVVSGSGSGADTPPKPYGHEDNAPNDNHFLGTSPPSPPLAGFISKPPPWSPVPESASQSHQGTPTLQGLGSPFISVDFDEVPPTPTYPPEAASAYQRRPTSFRLFLRQQRGGWLSRRALLLGMVVIGTFVAVTTQLSSPPEKVVMGVTRASEKVSSAVEGLLGWKGIRNVYEPLDPKLVLNFAEPQGGVFTQLKAGVRYVTALSYGGHANQFISIGKLLYVAKVTNRVAIIPTLLPVHFDGHPQNISDFFDLPRFWHESKIPAVEWSLVKSYDNSGTANDEGISCWSVQEATAGMPNLYQWSTDVHNTWVNNWPLPPMMRGMGGFDLAYDALRMFDFDERARRDWIDQVKKEWLPQEKGDGSVVRKENMKEGFNPESAPPVDQLLCFDNALFMSPIMFPETFTVEPPLEPWVPGEDLSWIDATQFLRFNQKVEAEADRYLMKLFGVSSPSKIPPFISVHLRRGDFKEFAGLTALDKYTSAYERILLRLQERLDNPNSWRGPGKQHFRSFGKRAKDYAVLSTTDEATGSPFIDEVRALGWKVLDHGELQTEKNLGGWWPTILDAAILARGQAIVGTDRSTFSHLGGLRVKYWNGGIVETAV